MLWAPVRNVRYGISENIDKNPRCQSHGTLYSGCGEGDVQSDNRLYQVPAGLAMPVTVMRTGSVWQHSQVERSSLHPSNTITTSCLYRTQVIGRFSLSLNMSLRAKYFAHAATMTSIRSPLQYEPYALRRRVLVAAYPIYTFAATASVFCWPLAFLRNLGAYNMLVTLLPFQRWDSERF